MVQRWWAPSGISGFNPYSVLTQETLNCGHERWEVVVDGRLHNGVGGVEVAVRKVVAHPRDVYPRDGRLAGKQVWIDGLDGFADLDEPDSYCVKYEPVVEPASSHVIRDCVGSRDDVFEPLVVGAAHSGIASASTS